MKKVDYRSTGKKHEDKIPWTSLVAAEVARIKKSDISPDSLYYKNTFVDYEQREMYVAAGTGIRCLLRFLPTVGTKTHR